MSSGHEPADAPGRATTGLDRESALLPRDVAGPVAHNLFHFLGEGGAIIATTGALVGIKAQEGSTALLPLPGIQAIQFVLLAVGIGLSLYAVWRIARKRYQAPRNLRWTLAPFGAMVAGLAVFNIGMFLLPMAHRM